MIALRDLLGRFGDIILGEDTKKEAVQKVLERILGIQVSKENILIRDRVIYLNTKPIYKNEIHIKKAGILDELQKLLGEKTPTDIR